MKVISKDMLNDTETLTKRRQNYRQHFQGTANYSIGILVNELEKPFFHSGMDFKVSSIDLENIKVSSKSLLRNSWGCQFDKNKNG